MIKKKILYIYHTSIVGGGSYCLYNIVEKLDKERYLPFVLLKEEGPLGELLEKLGAEVYFENTLSTVPYNKSIFNITSIKSIFKIIQSISRIKKHILKIQPDIVYVNTMMMHPYLCVAKNLKIKTIIHIREHWPKDEHNFQFKYAKKNIEKYADRIVAINKTSASMVDSDEKKSIVYDWIDFSNRDEYFPIQSIFGKDYKSLKIFTYTAGIDTIKGSMEVVKIFSSKVLDKEARLLIFGTNTTFVYNGFRGTLAKYLSIFNYDTYSNKVKKMILKDNRIICLPSTYKLKQIIESSYCILSFFTIPHANLILAESICLGQIVIAASTPEALEYSNNGKSALLFKMNNIDEFADNIIKLCSNYDFYRENAKNGMVHNKLLFDSSRNSSVLNDIYNDLLLK